MEWYLKVVRDNYSNFEGRVRRTEYWMFTLFNIVIVLALIFVIGIVSETLAMIAYVIYMLAILTPSLAVSVRRLHDTGKSGWFLLLNLVAGIGSIIFFIFMIMDSTPGENQYGPNPKEG